MRLKIKKNIHDIHFCREEGIRTLDTLLAYTHFPGVRLRPLGHLSIFFLTKKNTPPNGLPNNKKKIVC